MTITVRASRAWRLYCPITGGFTAFIPWTLQRENTSLGRFIKEEATAVEYLQTLAISRIYLDNFENVQSS